MKNNEFIFISDLFQDNYISVLFKDNTVTFITDDDSYKETQALKWTNWIRSGTYAYPSHDTCQFDDGLQDAFKYSRETPPQSLPLSALLRSRNPSDSIRLSPESFSVLSR